MNDARCTDCTNGTYTDPFVHLCDLHAQAPAEIGRLREQLQLAMIDSVGLLARANDCEAELATALELLADLIDEGILHACSFPRCPVFDTTLNANVWCCYYAHARAILAAIKEQE